MLEDISSGSERDGRKTQAQLDAHVWFLFSLLSYQPGGTLNHLTVVVAILLPLPAGRGLVTDLQRSRVPFYVFWLPCTDVAKEFARDNAERRHSDRPVWWHDRLRSWVYLHEVQKPPPITIPPI